MTMRLLRNPNNVADKRVCIFVSYSPNATIKRHVRYHLKRLKSCGFTVIFVLVVDEMPQDATGLSTDGVHGFFLRKNAGFDFGAWADAFRSLPSLWNAKCVLLVNDSVFGPIGNYARVLNDAAALPAHFIGMIESYEVKRHFQSYFLIMNRPMLQDPSVQRYWTEIENLETKLDVIRTYEVNLLEKFSGLGHSSQAVFPHLFGERWPFNPPLVNWRPLLEAGFPFIKVELLRDNPFQVDIAGWEKTIRDPELLAAIQEHLALGSSPASAGTG